MNVIGPIDRPTWNLMRQINTSLRWMQSSDRERWGPCIEKEGAVYEELKKRYVA